MDDYSNKPLIDEATLIGVQFYKRVRLEEYQVQVTAQQNITEYPGLVVISKEPAIRYNLISPKTTTHKDWSTMILKSVELALLNLIINGFVELTFFTDKKLYINGLVKYDYSGYYLTVSKAYSGKDYLSSCIIKSIKATEIEYPRKKDLSLFIEHLVGGQIGSDPDHLAAKEFFAVSFAGYSEDTPFSFQDRKQFLGKYTRFEIVFTPKQKAKLVVAYENLSAISISLKQQSTHFSEYNRKIRRHIQGEFSGRLPGD